MSRYLPVRGIKLFAGQRNQIGVGKADRRANAALSKGPAMSRATPPSAFARHVVRSRRPGPPQSPFRAFPPLVRRRQNSKKTDGWLAGFESDGLPHDKTRTFGDGAPAIRSQPGP